MVAADPHLEVLKGLDRLGHDGVLSSTGPGPVPDGAGALDACTVRDGDIPRVAPERVLILPGEKPLGVCGDRCVRTAPHRRRGRNGRCGTGDVGDLCRLIVDGSTVPVRSLVAPDS